MSNNFLDCSKAKIEIDLEKIPDLSELFYNTDLKKFVYLEFDTNAVYNMSKMFFGCRSLTSLPDSMLKWKVSNVYYMKSMFCRCISLKKN